MNQLLIQSVTILNPGGEFNNSNVDVLIAGGLIKEISKKIEVPARNVEVIDANGCFLARGFFDLNVNFGEPGLETKEDIESGCRAAAAGGFTGIALMPNTQPPIHSKAEVSFISSRSASNLVSVFPLGTISQYREGKEMAEMFDMKQTGAIAFTDGNRPLTNSGLMSRALLYSRSFDGLIMSFAEDQDIAGKAKMNEGVMSTFLGMKGNPSLAEELMISRDLYLAAYNESRIHFSTISCAGSVELIRKAKKDGVHVTCDVAAHQLHYTEDDLEGFDSLFKVKPPLRTALDRKALIAGLKDGTIDAIVSQHTPHEIEFKDVEFEIASYGMIGLQTVLPIALQIGLKPELLIEKLSLNPRKILKLNNVNLQEGEVADLVLFNPDEEWIFDEQTNQSRSFNSPLMGKKLKGKVKLVLNKGKTQKY